MTKTWRVALGLVVSGACLWYVFRGFNFHELGRLIKTASFIWFLPAILFFILNALARSLRWRILLTPIQIIPLKTVMPALIAGFFMNNILPARGGELVRAVTLSKKTKIPVSSLLGSIVAERLTDLVGLMAIVLMASRLLPWGKLPVKSIGSILIAGFFISMGILFFSKRIQTKTGNRSTLVIKLMAMIQHLTEGFLALGSPSKIIPVILLSLGIWMGELMMAFFISRTVFLSLGIFESACLITGISVGVMIPAAPGFIGTYEFFGKSALVLLGKPEAAALSLVLILHFFQLTMMAILALPSFLMLSKTTPENV